MATTSYAIALGSNRRHGRHGPPARVIATALETIGHAGMTVVARSPIVATPALGPAGRSFANAAAIVETELDPAALLARLKTIEQRFGRRRGRRWGARVLDLDILLWSEGAWRQRRPPRLSIPHVGLAVRDFVLQPLAAVAPGWRVPPHGRTVSQLRARLRRPRPVDPARPHP